MKNILITGGAGFIGSHVVKRFVKNYSEYNIINLDSLTYAGNLENLRDIRHHSNYFFERIDITKAKDVNLIFKKYNPEAIIHLAAESHVDRSIKDPTRFVQTNVLGTVNLLNGLLHYSNNSRKLFYHISTDEVYGALGEKGQFFETTPYAPNSPYSASKASSDHFVRAYGETYGLPFVISNCSNNYGPFQYPEKLIPLFIQNILMNKSLPVYGNGQNVRDWLYVEDHVEAIDLIFHKGGRNETYNIGGNNEIKNIELVTLLCSILDKHMNRPEGKSQELIKFVDDRPGHDFRYSINTDKIKSELSWTPKTSFHEGLEKTIVHYLEKALPYKT
jgi:dTDP-glucose 4,6-dehydratase